MKLADAIKKACEKYGYDGLEPDHINETKHKPAGDLWKRYQDRVNTTPT